MGGEEPRSERSRLLIGRVVKPHGIRGEIKVQPYSGDPGNLVLVPEIFWGPDADPADRQEVAGGRAHGGMAILQLRAIRTRSEAERLVGREVWVDRARLPGLAEDEFYWQELEGRRVLTDDGRELGRVTGLMATGGHDVLIVAGRGREYLIPATREFLVETPAGADYIVVAPTPGLLEMND